MVIENKARNFRVARLNATSKDALSKLVKAWESKNAQRAVRGAGLGLMAVSLAACGGSDEEVDALRDEMQALLDTDGDGVPDGVDAFPLDPNEWSDGDNDGVGDNSDGDATLTHSTDNVTANAFVAPLVYTPGGNDRINSLQDEDVLTGTGVNPTLNATLGNSNDNGSITITPTLNGIQTINVAFSSTDGTGLDLQDATGLQVLNITRVSQALNDGSVGTITGTENVRVLNLESATDALSISNSSQFNDFYISYRIGALDGADTVAVNLTNVLAQDLYIGEQRVEGFTPEYHIENLVLTATASNSTVQELHFAPAGALESANQTLTLSATGGNITIGIDSDADGNVIEHNAGMRNETRLSEIIVTGAAGRTVTIGEVSDVATFRLSGGASQAHIHANITDAADFDSALASGSSFTTGSGNDILLVNGLGNDLRGNVTMNAGNDTLDVNDSIERLSMVSMGSGDDIVLIGDELEGGTSGGAQIDLGAGNDRVTFGRADNADQSLSVNEEASILGGDGDDIVEFNLSFYEYHNVNTLIQGDSTAVEGDDNLGGSIRFGAGNDKLVITLRGENLYDQSSSSYGVIEGHVDGSDGSDTILVRGTRDIYNLVDSNTSDTATVAAGQAGFGVTGVETLTLVSEAALGGSRLSNLETTKENNQVDVLSVSRDDDGQTADYAVDLMEFDSALTSVNLRHLDGVMRVKGEEETSFSSEMGEHAAYDLDNLAGEIVTLSAMEINHVTGGVGFDDRAVLNVLGNIYNAGGFGEDVTLDLHRTSAGAQSLVLKATVLVDEAGNDTALNGNALPYHTAGVVNYDVVLNTANITTLNLTVDSSASHHVRLDSGITTAVVVNGAASGANANLTLHDVSAATVNTSAYAGNVYVGIVRGVDHTITMGGGNDVVRLGDGVSIALTDDNVNMGAGNDVLVFSGTGATAGLTSGDTVTGGAGADVLGFGGEGAVVVTALSQVLGRDLSSTVHLRESEFTNVTGFETFQLGVGNASGTGNEEGAPELSGYGANRYDLVLNNDIIAANAVVANGKYTLNIVNDDTRDAVSAVSVVGTNASHNVNYTGADNQDRLIVDDASIQGLDTFNGGGDNNVVATQAVIFDTSSGLYSDRGAYNRWNDGDVLDIYGNRGSGAITQVTASDLANVTNVEEIHFTAVSGNNQVLELTLDATNSGFREIHTRGVGNTYSENSTFENRTDSQDVATLNLNAAAYTEDLFVDTRDGATSSLTNNDNITTGSGNDIVWAGFGDDEISTGAGNDYLVGGTGFDVLYGGAGNDIFAFAAGDSSAAYLRSGQDSIRDWNAGDLIELRFDGHSGGFNVATDVSIGTYVNVINTGNGFQTTTYLVDVDGTGVGSSNDLAFSVTTNGSTAAFADAAAAQAATVLNFENASGNITGGVNNDIIIGAAAGGQTIRGMAGDDFLTSSISSASYSSTGDTIYGGDGADTINAFNYSPVAAADRFYGGGDAAVKDQIVFEVVGDTSNNGDDSSGDDNDVTFEAYGIRVTGTGETESAAATAIANAINGHAVLGTLLTASVSSSVFVTVVAKVDGDFANFVVTGADDVTINAITTVEGVEGNDGNDVINGYYGNDWLIGGRGVDVLRGGQGNDSFVVFGTEWDGNDTIDGGSEDNGSSGTDTIYVVGDFLSGGNISRVEVIDLSAYGNVDLDLSAETDGFTITGGANSVNVIVGSQGSDTIGAVGNDTIDGQNGFDTITLGSGNFTIVSSAVGTVNADRISGFDATVDKFDYNGVLLNGNGTNSNGIAGVEVGTSLTFDDDDILAVYATDIANGGGNTQGTAFASLLGSTAATVASNFSAFVAQLLATGGALNGVTNGLTSGESGLLSLDNGTGTVVLRVDSNGGAYDAAELSLVSVFTDEILVVSDFI